MGTIYMLIKNNNLWEKEERGKREELSHFS